MGVYQIALLASERSNGEIGLLGTIAGMLIVFLALIVIAILISQFKYIANMGNKKNQAAVEVKPVLEAAPIVEEKSEEVDDYELVAVITAAIASSLNTTSDKFVVKSLKRVSGTKSAWNARGRQENLQSSIS